MTEINLIWNLERLSYVWFCNLKNNEINTMFYWTDLRSQFICFWLQGTKVQPHPEFLLVKVFFQASSHTKHDMWHSSSSGSHKLTFSCRNLLLSHEYFFLMCDYSSPGLALSLYHTNNPVWIVSGSSVTPPLLSWLQCFLSGMLGFFSFQIYWRSWRIKGWEWLRPCFKMGIVTLNSTGSWWELLTTALLILLVPRCCCGACSAVCTL